MSNRKSLEQSRKEQTERFLLTLNRMFQYEGREKELQIEVDYQFDDLNSDTGIMTEYYRVQILADALFSCATYEFINWIQYPKGTLDYINIKNGQVQVVGTLYRKYQSLD
jgi:hypothetical protein